MGGKNRKWGGSGPHRLLSPATGRLQYGATVAVALPHALLQHLRRRRDRTGDGEGEGRREHRREKVRGSASGGSGYVFCLLSA
jgi:hypothetical protein